MFHCYPSSARELATPLTGPLRSVVGCLHALLLGVALMLGVTRVEAAATSAAPRIGPPPSWTRDIELAGPAADKAPLDASGGVQYLLYNQEVRATDRLHSAFRHFALRATHESGLSKVAHVEVQFNPAYQTLTFHHVRLRRAGQTIDKLKPSAIQVLQRERELEYRVLDGTKTANLFLDDVRVGDVIEYAYTVDGSNPVFGGNRYGRVDLQWSVPVERLRYRLLWPVGRPLHLLVRNGAVDVPAALSNGFEERIWDHEHVAALALEADAPGWYDPYPSVAWSDFASWRAVVDWALPLYRVPSSLGVELSRIQSELTHAQSSPEERVAAVLRLVQSQVRYLGIEVGANSHAPHPPGLVYQRRFGDCKDKALLMVALLKGMGIDAEPALVNTQSRRGIVELQPSPGAFDHVIVHLRLGASTFWLDPTRPTQMGLLASVYQPDYGYALVVHHSTQALTPMAGIDGIASRVNKREIALRLDAAAGPGKPSSMIVKSVFTGLAAESIRSDLAGQSREELQKLYLNFYAGYYPGLTIITPLEVNDDQNANRMTLTEHYSLPEVWHKPEGASQVQLQVYGGELREFLKQTSQPVRKSPLYMAYPLEVDLRTDVLLPANWNVKPSTTQIKTDAFQYTGTATWPSPSHVVITDSYRTLADHVKPDRVAGHAEKLDQVLKSIGYSIYYGADNSSSSYREEINLPVLVIGILLAAGLVYGATVAYRFDPPVSQPVAGAQVQGIGGWLLLASLVLLSVSPRALYEIWSTLPAYGLTTWSTLTTVGSERYSALWAPVLLYELFTHLFSVVFGVLLAVLLVLRRSSLPRLGVAFCLASACLGLIDHLLATALPAHALSDPSAVANWAAAAKGIVVNLVWAAYILKSERVRATFVERRGAGTGDAQMAVGLG